MISAIVSISLLAAAPPEPQPRARPNLLEVASVGGAAPMFGLPVLNVDTFGAKRFGMERYVGKKADDPRPAAILAFCASYCEPCVRELAALKTLEADLEAATVPLGVVIVDHEDEGMEQMRKIAVDDLRLRYPVLWDEARFVARRYGAETLPFIAVVDRAGVLRWVHAGDSEKMLDELKAELRKLGIGIREAVEPKPQRKKKNK